MGWDPVAMELIYGTYEVPSWCEDYMVTDPCSGAILQCGPRNSDGETCRDTEMVHVEKGYQTPWDGLTCAFAARARHRPNARF